MPGNAAPIFTRVGDVQWALALTAANTAKDGTGTVATVFTADATNGGYVAYILCMPLGTNVSSVARLFINNGSVNTTAANNSMLQGVTLPSSALTETLEQTAMRIPVNMTLPPGYKLNVVLGTAVAAGWQFTAVGGKY